MAKAAPCRSPRRRTLLSALAQPRHLRASPPGTRQEKIGIFGAHKRAEALLAENSGLARPGAMSGCASR